MTGRFESGRAALRFARHEWTLILKEPRFLAPFLITPMLMLGLQAYAIYFRPPGTPYESLLLSRALLLMLAVLAPSASVPLGADCFAGEKERNTLEILLCLPAGHGSLFWGKVLGIYPMPVLVGWLGQGLIACMMAVNGLWLYGFGTDVIKAMVLTPFLGLFLASLATLMSLISDSVRAAAQLTSLFMLLVFFSVTAFSSSFYSSDAVYFGFIAVLTAASIICFALARRRFPLLS